MGCPNCWRSFTYPTVMSSIAWPSPTSTAAVPRAPRSSASSIRAASSVTRSPPSCWTRAARRARSTVATGSRSTAPRPASTRPALERSSSSSASAAQGTRGPPRSVATMPWPRPSSGPATIAVSTIGCGSATRPASSRIGTRKHSSSPMPPSASGTRSDSTPIASRLSHTPRSSSPGGASSAARTTAGVASFASRSRTASRKATWSSDSANLMAGSSSCRGGKRQRRRDRHAEAGAERRPEHAGSSREPQDALGGDVALDLVGAGVDRARQRELPALAPRPLELGLGSEEVEGDLVELDVELAPPELREAGLGAWLGAAGQLGDGGQRLLLVGVGADPRGRRRAGAGWRRRRRPPARRGARRWRGTAPGSAGSARARSRRWPSRRPILPRAPRARPRRGPRRRRGTRPSKKTSANPSSPSSRPKPRTVTPGVSSGMSR